MVNIITCDEPYHVQTRLESINQRLTTGGHVYHYISFDELGLNKVSKARCCEPLCVCTRAC